MLYKHRERFNYLSLKVGMIFSRIPLSPNQWTALSIIPAILGLFSVYYSHIFLAFLFFAITAFVDVIDGAVARVIGRVTKFGAYLDTVVDRYIEFIIVISFIFLNLPSLVIPSVLWIFLLLFGSLISSFIKAASVEKGVVAVKGGHGTKGGLLEHTDRMLLYCVVFLIYNFLGSMPAIYLVVLLAVLANVSALQRFWGAMNAKD